MAGKLRRELSLGDADAAYHALVGRLKALPEQQALTAMAKIVLLLANHIGDPDVLDEAVATALSE